MSDEFTLTLNSPITEEQWDMIEDIDFDYTNEITFHTKHGKEVKFVKASAQPEDYAHGFVDGYKQGKKDAQPEIIRCKDCKWFEEINQPFTQMFCRKHYIDILNDDFCSYAERRTDGEIH